MKKSKNICLAIYICIYRGGVFIDVPAQILGAGTGNDERESSRSSIYVLCVVICDSAVVCAVCRMCATHQIKQLDAIKHIQQHKI